MKHTITFFFLLIFFPNIVLCQKSVTFYEYKIGSIPNINPKLTIKKDQLFTFKISSFDQKKHELKVLLGGVQVTKNLTFLNNEFKLDEGTPSFGFIILDTTNNNKLLLNFNVTIQSKKKTNALHFNFQGKNYLFKARKNTENEIDSYRFDIEEDTIGGSKKQFRLEDLDQNAFRAKFVSKMAELYDEKSGSVNKKSDFIEYVSLTKKGRRFYPRKNKKINGKALIGSSRRKLRKKFKRQFRYLLDEANYLMVEADKQGIYFPMNLAFGKDNTPNIEFYGTGDLQNTINSGESFQGNIGLGVLFQTVFKRRFLGFNAIEVDASINVASTIQPINAIVDTIIDGDPIISNQNTFGSFVQLPSNSGRSASINIKTFWDDGSLRPGRLHSSATTRPTDRQFVATGLQLSFTGATRSWQADTSKTNDTIKVEASALSLKLGFFHELIPFKYRKNYSIMATFDYSMRGLVGSISRGNENQEFRKMLIGSPDTWFNGIEVGLNLRIKNIKARVAIPYLFLPKGTVPAIGITGVQFYTSISFVGGFPLKLN